MGGRQLQLHFSSLATCPLSKKVSRGMKTGILHLPKVENMMLLFLV